MDSRDSIVVRDPDQGKILAAVGGQIAQAWVEEPTGRRNLEALGAWLSGLSSQHTRRSYASSVDQFFCWMMLRRGCIPTPEQIVRADAWAFIKDQRELPADWVAYRLRWGLDHDDRIMLDVIDSTPGVGVSEISRRIEKPEPWVHDRLAEMTRAKRIVRIPRQVELRAGRKRLADASVINIRVYRYYPGKIEPPKHGTMATKVAALRSYWSFIADTGENTGQSPILVHNIWMKPGRREHAKAVAEAATARATKTPNAATFLRLLAQTFVCSDRAAAAELLWTEGIAPEDDKADVFAMRDRCLLVWMVGLGLRASEASSLRMADVSATGMVVVRGKGDKTRLVRAPRVCLDTLASFRRAIEAWVRIPNKRRRQNRLGMLGERAPLFPAIGRWGATSRPDVADAGMTPGSISKAMLRLARMAGMSPAEARKAHPHGLRHLGAHLAVDSGVPLPVIQKALGHSSLAITGIYVEEHDQEKVCLRP